MVKTSFTFYDQVDGVVMGSPLGPALANLFMGFHEKDWLNSEEGSKIRHYRRYVDDIFCTVDNEQDAQNFLIFLNSQNSSIKFTMEKEAHKRLPFLDVECEIEGDNAIIYPSWYSHPYTVLLLGHYWLVSPPPHPFLIISHLSF